MDKKLKFRAGPFLAGNFKKFKISSMHILRGGHGWCRHFEGSSLLRAWVVQADFIRGTTGGAGRHRGGIGRERMGTPFP